MEFGNYFAHRNETLFESAMILNEQNIIQELCRELDWVQPYRSDGWLLRISSMDDFFGFANEIGVPNRQTLNDPWQGWCLLEVSVTRRYTI